MNFGFFRKNRSVVYNWIVSYMVLILIPVVLTGSVYFIAKKTIEAEINNSNMLVLENIRSNLDNTLGEVDKFSIEIAANQDIQDAYNLSEIDYTSYYTLYQAASDLRNYKIFSSSLQSFYIYLNNVKMVLSPGVVNSANYYFSGYVSSKGYDISDWINAVSRIHNGEYTLMPYHQNVLEDTKTVAFIRTFPIPSFGNISANLVVMMDFSSLTDKNTSDRSVFIIDSQSNIMAQSDTKSKYTGINYKELRGNEGVLTKSIGGKRVVISYITLNENNWKCITVTPEAVFWQKAEFIRDIMIGGLFVCLLLGGLMAYYFIKRNYDPLKEVISYFRLKVYSENVYDNNEFNYITRALNTTLEAKEKIQLKLEMQNIVLKSNFIVSLLKGRHTSMPVDELMTAYDIAFRHDHYNVVAIYIESIDESFWKANTDENIDQYYMTGFVITNVVEEIINRNNVGYMAEVDDMRACIVNTGMATEEFKKQLIADISEAKDFISQNFNINLIFSVGALHDGIEEIHEAFNEAVNALEYSRIMGRNDTVFYSDIAEETETAFYYPIEKEHKLINCIKSSDATGANLIIEDIFKNDLIKNSTSMEIARFLMLNLVGTILKTFSVMEDEGDRELIEKINPAGQLMKCKTLAETKNMMLKIVESVCNYKMTRREETDYKIRDAVKQFVVKNYSDASFGIGSIAVMLAKSPYYISKIFKEQTGEGILNYINGVRIEKAKELLKNSGLTQEQIAEKVGFTNVRTFQRVFKKLEGITPGKLKD